MTTPIKIKNSLLTAVPSSLANGEPAFTANGDILYLGSNGLVVPIGGKRVPGVLTANQALVANSTSFLDVIKTANLYIGTATVNVINAVSNSTVLGLAANNELTTTWAIKNYVDIAAAAATGKLSGNGLSSNTTHNFVLANTGIVSNSSGVFTIQDITTTGSPTFTNLTVSGNLVINGALTNINATNLTVSDPIIKLANGNATTDTLSIGVYGSYGNSTVTQFSGFFRDQANAALWTFFNSQKEPTTTVDTSNNTYSIGTVLSYLKSGGLSSNATAITITANSTLSVALSANTLSLSTPLPVASGGLGLNTITLNSMLVGNGTTAPTLISGLDGTILQSVSGVPTFAVLDGGTF